MPKIIIKRPAIRCAFCELLISDPNHNRKWCSERCRHIGMGRTALFSTIEYHTCRHCGGHYVRRADRVGEFCSNSCAKAAYRRHRRDVKRAGQRQGERFTLRDIAERDNWRCHLCGKKVPDRPYAARPLDATLDHLIPVADGGEHVRANVKLAHNACNWQRSTGGEVQLLLVG